MPLAMNNNRGYVYNGRIYENRGSRQVVPYCLNHVLCTSLCVRAVEFVMSPVSKL